MYYSNKCQELVPTTIISRLAWPWYHLSPLLFFAQKFLAQWVHFCRMVWRGQNGFRNIFVTTKLLGGVPLVCQATSDCLYSFYTLQLSYIINLTWRASVPSSSQHSRQKFQKCRIYLGDNILPHRKSHVFQYKEALLAIWDILLKNDSYPVQIDKEKNVGIFRYFPIQQNGRERKRERGDRKRKIYFYHIFTSTFLPSADHTIKNR